MTTDPTPATGPPLPNFFVIGAPRSGTTSLYEYLDAHPDIAMSTVKEPDFFSFACLDAVHPLGGGGAATLEAAAEDPVVAEKLAAYRALFSGVRSEQRVGEASAVYLAHPTAAWHLKAYRPDAPFVVILRDPAERAYSHYVHGRRIYAEAGATEAEGAPGRTLEEEWVRAVDAAAASGPREPAVSDPEVWVSSGCYHAHLTRWYSLFPREQFLVFLFEDLVAAPEEVMRRTYEFLGVDAGFTLPTTEAFNASVVPKNQRIFTLFTTQNAALRWARSAAPPRLRGFAVRTRNRLLGREKPGMDPELHRKLRAIYRDDTLALQDLLGRDLSAWLAPQ